jgi:hypothetical protein
MGAPTVKAAPPATDWALLRRVSILAVSSTFLWIQPKPEVRSERRDVSPGVLLRKWQPMILSKRPGRPGHFVGRTGSDEYGKDHG